MNKQTVMIVAVVVLALVGGAWYFSNQSPVSNETMVEETPTTTETMKQETATDEAMMAGETKEFTLTGANFKFSLTEFRVNKGDTVKINFTSNDMMHDFVVDEFNARTKVVPSGESDSVTFVADKSGEFEYYCSVGQHRANGMVGTLIVE